MSLWNSTWPSAPAWASSATSGPTVILSASRWMAARRSVDSRMRASRSLFWSCTRAARSSSKNLVNSDRTSRSERSVCVTMLSISARSGPCRSIWSARAFISARNSSKAWLTALKVSWAACCCRASSSSSTRMRSSLSSWMREDKPSMSRARSWRSTSRESWGPEWGAACLTGGSSRRATSTARETSSYLRCSSIMPSPLLLAARVASRS
mmetsp:Transcript_84608/g.262803  ORF Transcript_84608/g.262803 Transcript_84608/m.262803 type:complete len:210 (+) Transcript_84608:1041-1670(+)